MDLGRGEAFLNIDLGKLQPQGIDLNGFLVDQKKFWENYGNQ